MSFQTFARLAARSALRRAPRNVAPTFRREMSSHGGSSSVVNFAEDKAWIAGSALVFGSSLFYILGTDGKKSEGASHGHSTNVNHINPVEVPPVPEAAPVPSDSEAVDSTAEKSDAPTTEAEESATSGSEASEPDEVKESMQQALNADAPKTAQAEETKEAASEKPADDVTESMQKSLEADAPKAAKAAEEGRS